MNPAPLDAPSDHWDKASALFRCLGSPLRVGIITVLSEGERSATELVNALGVSQPLVSQHLKILSENCLITGQRSGRRIIYRLMDDHVGHIVLDAIQHVGEHDHPEDPGHITIEEKS